MKPKLKAIRTIRSQELETGRVLIIAVFIEPTSGKPGRGVQIGIVR